MQRPWPACAASPGAHSPALARLEGSHQSVLPQSTCRTPSAPSCSGQRHRALHSLHVPHPAHCSGCFLDFSLSSTQSISHPFSRATIYKERSPHLERSFLLLQGGQYCFSKPISFIWDQLTRPCQKLCISVFCHLPAHCTIICQLHWQLFHASFGRNIKKTLQEDRVTIQPTKPVQHWVRIVPLSQQTLCFHVKCLADVSVCYVNTVTSITQTCNLIKKDIKLA